MLFKSRDVETLVWRVKGGFWNDSEDAVGRYERLKNLWLQRGTCTKLDPPHHVPVLGWWINVKWRSNV